MICPYCDSDQAMMRSVIRSEFDDSAQKLIVVRNVFCPQCRNTSYAVRLIEDKEENYSVIRRDELRERTGIRIIHPVLSKRACR